MLQAPGHQGWYSHSIARGDRGNSWLQQVDSSQAPELCRVPENLEKLALWRPEGEGNWEIEEWEETAFEPYLSPGAAVWHAPISWHANPHNMVPFFRGEN